MAARIQQLTRPAGLVALLMLLAVAAMSIMPGGAKPSFSSTPEIVGPTSTTEALTTPAPPASVVLEGGIVATGSDIDPWLVTVATVLPQVSSPRLLAEPGGEQVSFSDPVTNPTYFGTDLAMLVVDTQDDWLKVQLPVRPNGTTAWIVADEVTLNTHTFHAEIQLGKHRLRVWNADELIVDTAAVVGTEATPTPLGSFYVNDKVPAENPAGSYGPWILSLSAHSEVLDSFIDGRPVIAIHGTNRQDLLGTDSSNGCIRIPNDLVALLAEVVPLGTPVDILA